LLRLALICDFVEEGWPSMDLVGEMLFEQVSGGHPTTIRADRIRPAFRRRATAFSRFRQSPVAWNVDRLWNRMVEYPRWLHPRRERYDIFHIVDHSYAHLVLDLPRNRSIVTCHDLDAFRCLIQPEREPRPLWFKRMARRILGGFQRAAHVVFVSETVREEAAGFGLVSMEKSSVIHNGVTPGICSDDADREAARLLGFDNTGPLLLHVGSTIPRKRIDLLLTIFAGVLKSVPSAKLVRAGGPFSAPQAALARQLGVERSIIHLPFMDRAVLTAVYRRASLLLQPSEAEGFGLPLIEAMVCGCPVVASDIPVLREVGGHAAAYCRVGKVSEWTQTVVRLLGQRAVQSAGWHAFQRRSIENASRFSWREAADRMIGVYHRIIETS
jgi:glycosyltransferase involved in cell wall biosynthesis